MLPVEWAPSLQCQEQISRCSSPPRTKSKTIQIRYYTYKCRGSRSSWIHSFFQIRIGKFHREPISGYGLDLHIMYWEKF
jgi:hypothetical protein